MRLRLTRQIYFIRFLISFILLAFSALLKWANWFPAVNDALSVDLWSYFIALIASLPNYDWACALVFGDVSHLSPEILAAFKRLGIYHLIVISGLHVGFFFQFSSTLIFYFIRFAYSIRSISPLVFILIQKNISLLALLTVISLGHVSGWGPSTQRAVFILAVIQFVKISRFEINQMHFWVVVACLQLLIFRGTFFTTSNALTWSVYLLVFGGFAKAHDSNFKIAETIVVNIKISMVVALFLSQMSLLGIVVNLFSPSVGKYLFYGCLLSVLLFWAEPYQLVFTMFIDFGEGVLLALAGSFLMRWFYIDLSGGLNGFRPLLAVIVLAVIGKSIVFGGTIKVS